jgi:hypothetical protein
MSRSWKVLASKRIQRLAAKFGEDLVTLRMVDGSVHEIVGTIPHFIELMDVLAKRDVAKSRGESQPKSRFDSEIDWLRDAVEFEEEHFLFELLGAIIAGPDVEVSNEPTEAIQ